MSRRLPVGLVPSDGQSSKGTVLDCHCVVCCRAPEDLTFDTVAIVSCSLALRIPGRLCSERAGLGASLVTTCTIRFVASETFVQRPSDSSCLFGCCRLVSMRDDASTSCAAVHGIWDSGLMR